MFSININAQQVTTITDQQLFKLLQTNTDTVYVVNFWATWCKPCVEELPYFFKLEQTYKNRNVKVVFVSLDFKNQVENRLKPFMIKNNMPGPVFLLDAPNANQWVPKVDASWSGAIPATVIFNKSKKVFIEGETTYDELIKNVNTLIK